MRKHISIILVLACSSLLLNGCQPEHTEEENKVNPPSSQEQQETPSTSLLPEIEAFLHLDDVMIKDGVIVNHQQKNNIINWLTSLKLEPTEAFKDAYSFEKGIPTINEDAEAPLYLRYQFDCGDESFYIYDKNHELLQDYYLLLFKNSENAYLVTKKAVQQDCIKNYDGTMITDALGTTYFPDTTIPSDAKISEQYLSKNQAEITIDLPYFMRNVWKEAEFSEDPQTKLVEQLLFAFQTKQEGIHSQLKSVMTLLEPLKQEFRIDSFTEIEIDGKTYPLEYPVHSWSQFYRGSDVRQKFQELYHENVPQFENSFAMWNSMTYEPNLDIYSLYEYRDGAVGGNNDDTCYIIDKKNERNEMILNIAQIFTETWWDKDTVNMTKNSALPLLPRHFSEASKADGILTVSELINDQKENLNFYEIHGTLNEWGTYSLTKIINKTTPHIPSGDIIFYNNYKTDSGDIEFLPLFDCNLCQSANYELLNTANDKAFYEDENIAVIFIVYSNEGNPTSLIPYLFDKKTNQFNNLWLSKEESLYYWNQLKKDNPHLPEDTPMMKFEMNGKSYLFLDWTKGTKRTLIELK